MNGSSLGILCRFIRQQKVQSSRKRSLREGFGFIFNCQDLVLAAITAASETKQKVLLVVQNIQPKPASIDLLFRSKCQSSTVEIN